MIRGKSRIAVIVLLCITMINSVLFGSAAVFAESRGNTDTANIEQYLDDAQIIIEGGEVYNPKDTMNPEGSFSVKLYFSEITNGRQFPESGIMTYQIPASIDVLSSIKDQAIKDIKKDKQIGTYTIDKRTVTVELDSDYVKKYQNIEAFLTFEGSFTKEATEGKEEVDIVFSDSLSIDVKLEKKTTLTIKKESGNYDYKKGTVDYTVKVSTDYTAENVIVSDHMNNNLALVEGTIQVRNKNGENVSFKKMTAEKPESWKISVGTMAKGESYTITYQGRLSDSAAEVIEKSSLGTFEATISNTAYAKADNAKEVKSTEVKQKLVFSRITKKVAVENGRLKWTVTVNGSKHMDLDGYTLTDTLQDEALRLDKQTPMKITKLLGGDKTETVDAPDWSRLAGDSEKQWSYTFPAGSGKNTFTFVYYTNIPESDADSTAETGEGSSFKNKAVLSKDSASYQGSAAYKAPGTGFLKRKFRDSYNTSAFGNSIVTDKNGDLYLRWTSEITVPASGLKNVIFSDTITKGGNYKNHEFLSGLKASLGTPSKEDKFDEVKVESSKYTGPVTLVQKGTQGFELYFADSAKKADSKLPSNSASYMVKISYYTKVTETSHKNGTWRNVAAVKVGDQSYSDWEDYDSDKLFMEGSKNGALDLAANEITWTVKINTNRQGNGGNVIVKDAFSDNQEFDESYGVYVNGKKLDADQVAVNAQASGFQLTLNKVENSKTYTLVYKTKIKKGVMAESGEKLFTNTAKVTGKNVELSLPGKVSVDNTIMNKALSQEPTRHNDYQAGFTITVNPNKVLLNSESAEKANDYEIRDAYSKTMELDLNSFVIVRDDSKTLSAKDGDYTISHTEGEEKNHLTILIPKADGHKYTIQYKASVMGAVGDQVAFSNKADLYVKKTIDSDKVEDSVIIEKLSSAAGSTASELLISVQKYNRANTDMKLAGAEFSLYKDSVSEKNLLGTYETSGSDGTAVFGQTEDGNNLTYQGKAYYLESGVKYILKETKAPDGYEKSNKEYAFQLRDKNGNAVLKDQTVPAYSVGHVFSVGNEKYNFYIHKISAHTGEDITNAEFTLYTDPECKDKDAKAVSKSDSKGIHTFKNLMAGTYYLKESKVPQGYHDSGKVYTVVIDGSGEATIDGSTVNSEDKIYTIANTLAGSIRVTKEVKQDGVGVASDETFYTALFSDSGFKDRVSEVKALEMAGKESTTVTFDNVKVNETYYVAETDKDGNPLSNQEDSEQWVISYDNQVVTLDPNNRTAESKITNSFYSQYYWSGSIDVTKRVTMDGQDFESNSIFYVGLYTDQECTQQVGNIKPLVMNGKASTTVTFSDLSVDQTYYVAETDAEGNVITNAQEQLGCNMTIDKNKFTLTEEELQGKAVITNDFHDEEQFYYGGRITINKKTTFNGKAYQTNEVFYTALFADQKCTERVSDVKALEMNGKAAANVSFENLPYGTYYLAETDKNGKALTDMEAAKLGFTNLMNEEIKLDADAAEIDLENQMTEEYVKESGDDPENPKGTAAQTGDDSSMTMLMLVMLTALTALGIVLITGRRRRNS